MPDVGHADNIGDTSIMVTLISQATAEEIVWAHGWYATPYYNHSIEHGFNLSRFEVYRQRNKGSIRVRVKDGKVSRRSLFNALKKG